MNLTGIIFFGLLAMAAARIPSHWRNRVRAMEEEIDPRFPEYIVDPLVPCPSNETYVHPRNCAWFYRCHHNIAPEYYHRAYFECPHGTSFNQTMGHCTLHSEDNCQGIPYITTTPAPTTTQNSALSENTGATSPISGQIAPSSTDSSVTEEEALTPSTEIANVASSISVSVAEQCGECYDNNEVCNDYTVCPSGGAKVALRLCENSYKQCPPCTEQTRLCDEGMFYAPFEGKCYGDPSSSTMKCSNTIKCKRDREILIPEFVQDRHCELAEGCTVDGSVIDRTLLCRQFVQCHYDGSKPEDDRWSAKYASCANSNDIYSDTLERCISLQEVSCRFYL